MGNNWGGDGAGFGGVSRQVETRHVSETTERDLPIQQALLLVAIGIVAILTAFGDILLIGPLAGVLAGLAVLIYSALYIYVNFGVKWEAALIIPISLWLRFGFEIFESVWPPLHPNLPLWATVLLLAMSIPVYLACYLAGYRMSFEIVDPNWTPTIMPRRPETGPAWPRTRFGIPQPIVREVPRPIVVNGRGYDNGNQEVAEEPDAPDAPPGATVMSQSGVEVKADDLILFIRKAQPNGTSSRTWKDLADWKWKYWNAVVSILEQLQILSRRNKAEPIMLVTDFRECIRRIVKVVEEEGH
jgi:hypothetical protein